MKTKLVAVMVAILAADVVPPGFRQDDAMAPLNRSAEGDPLDRDGTTTRPFERDDVTSLDGSALNRLATIAPHSDSHVPNDTRAHAMRESEPFELALLTLDRVDQSFRQLRQARLAAGNLAAAREDLLRQRIITESDLQALLAVVGERSEHAARVLHEQMENLSHALALSDLPDTDRIAVEIAAIGLSHVMNLAGFGPEARSLLTLVARQLPTFRTRLESEVLRLLMIERKIHGWAVTKDVEESAILNPNAISFGQSDWRDLVPTYAADFRMLVLALRDAWRTNAERYIYHDWLGQLLYMTPRNSRLQQLLVGPLADESITGLLSIDGSWLRVSEEWGADDVGVNQVNARANIESVKNYLRNKGRLDDHDEQLEDLRRRIVELERWREDHDRRIAALEKAVATLQEQMKDMKEWRKEVEIRLADIELRLEFLETYGAKSVAYPVPRPGDRDRDQIDDRLEHILIQKCAPVFRMPEWGSRPPCSAEWFIQHCYLRGPGDQPGVEPDDARRHRSNWRSDPYAFMPLYRELAEQTGNDTGWRLQFASERYRSGEADPAAGPNTSWDSAIEKGNVGVYAHVVRANRTGTEYIVQYFVLLTWNETAYSMGIGNHEGDWLCATFWIRLPEAEVSPWDETAHAARSGESESEWRARGLGVLTSAQLSAITQGLENTPLSDRVIAMRVSNHGRYIDCRGENVDWQNVRDGSFHPVIWPEEGTNELWPNQGGRGYGGWPLGKHDGYIESMQRVFEARSAKDHDLGPVSPWVEEEPNGLNRDGKLIEGLWETHFRNPWYNPSGYRISFHFGRGETGTAVNEHKIVRPHDGANGPAYETRDIPNLGELGFPLIRIADAILHYRGKWGGWWKNSESPDGPTKEEMWIAPEPPATAKSEHRPAAQIDPRMRRQ